MQLQGFLAGSVVSPRVWVSPRSVEARYRGLNPLQIYAFHYTTPGTTYFVSVTLGAGRPVIPTDFVHKQQAAVVFDAP